MIKCKRANSQIQHATEFDFVVVYHRTPGLDEHLAITANTTTFIPIAEPHCHGSITVVGPRCARINCFKVTYRHYIDTDFWRLRRRAA